MDLFERRERLLIQRIQKLQAKQAGGEELALLADRNVFSLFLLNLEAQLFHVNFEHITHMVVDMTHTQVTGLMDMLIAWKEILPLVDKMKGAPVVNASMSVSIGGVQGGVTNQH